VATQPPPWHGAIGGLDDAVAGERGLQHRGLAAPEDLEAGRQHLVHGPALVVAPRHASLHDLAQGDARPDVVLGKADHLGVAAVEHRDP
jgi:hypothetical protein